MCLFVKELFYYKTREDLSTNRDVIESLSPNITNEKSKRKISI